ncbi:hypothetical protein FOZ60_015230 [Perkinsus olseni]|uniref:Uncharacterized protein n=1 Tax=Perkinsus olseni TaxID=32597 RepID=A0A7J6N8R7_PEROL|nr:hypothetical protein FOZ60_015230 [Perkinsus olseni]
MTLSFRGLGSVVYGVLIYTVFSMMASGGDAMPSRDEHNAKILTGVDVCQDPVYKDYNTCCHDYDVLRVCYFCGGRYDRRDVYADCCYDGPGKDAARRTLCKAMEP